MQETWWCLHTVGLYISLISDHGSFLQRSPLLLVVVAAACQPSSRLLELDISAAVGFYITAWMEFMLLYSSPAHNDDRPACTLCQSLVTNKQQQPVRVTVGGSCVSCSIWTAMIHMTVSFARKQPAS